MTNSDKPEPGQEVISTTGMTRHPTTWGQVLVGNVLDGERVEEFDSHPQPPDTNGMIGGVRVRLSDSGWTDWHKSSDHVTVYI